MLKLTVTIALSAALSAAVLLGGATATTAGTSPTLAKTPILTGGGSWETPIGTVGFNVALVELKDGSLQGNGISYLHSASGNGWFRFQVTDYMFLGSEILVVGLITQGFGVPPTWVGSQTALLVQDNGSGGALPDMALSGSGIPPFLTIEQIAASLPPVRFPLATGNYRIH